MLHLQIDIYENRATTPILTHVFHGPTQAAVQGIIDAHKQTDSFFRAAMTTKNFRGMQLRTTQQWLPPT